MTPSKLTPGLIKLACDEVKKVGYGVKSKLKGKNATPSTYFRYFPNHIIQEFRKHLPYDTRYIGGNYNTKGRTVYIFEIDALIVALEYLKMDVAKYIDVVRLNNFESVK